MTRHVDPFFAAREVRNGAAVLSEADTHHLIRVLRLRVDSNRGRRRGSRAPGTRSPRAAWSCSRRFVTWPRRRP